MNLIDLMWIILFVGGSAVAGAWTGTGWLGIISGGIAGYLLLIIIANLNARQQNEAPCCQCHVQRWDHYKIVRDDVWGCVFLSECGHRYIKRKGFLWFEIQEQNAPVLVQIRTFLGHWRTPKETEIVNHKYRLKTH